MRNKITIAGVLLLTSCATVKNTPEQDRTWAAAASCSTRYPSVQVDRVMPDGKYYFRTSQWSGEFQLYQSCMTQEYQRLKQSATRPEDRAARQPVVGPPAAEGSTNAPELFVWKWDDSTIPGPPAVEVRRPRPVVPTGMAAFSGVWSGTWDGVLPSRLIVESIDSGSARVVYAWADDRWKRFRGGWIRITALLSPEGSSSSLSWGSGPSFTFHLGENGDILEGRREDRGQVSTIQMKKVAP